MTSESAGGVMESVIETSRLRLRCWRNADRDAFAALHADAEVMRDLGGPIDRVESDAKLDRYRAALRRLGICRWAVESHTGEVLGYAGLMPSPADHPLGPHVEIGWRLTRHAWGRGFAAEAARAALADGFRQHGLTEVLAYTAPDNIRSQAVMSRVGLRRDPSRDFTAFYDDVGAWRGLVWAKQPCESLLRCRAS